MFVHVKSKITKILNSEENPKRKVLNQMSKPNDKTHQTKVHIPDLVQAYSNVENGGLKPLTCSLVICILP